MVEGETEVIKLSVELMIRGKIHEVKVSVCVHESWLANGSRCVHLERT